jgi:hypothetical protein
VICPKITDRAVATHFGCRKEKARKAKALDAAKANTLMITRVMIPAKAKVVAMAQNALATPATTTPLSVVFNPANQHRRFPSILLPPRPSLTPLNSRHKKFVILPAWSRGEVPNSVTFLTMPSNHDVNPATPYLYCWSTAGISSTEVMFAKRSKDHPVGNNYKQHLLPVPLLIATPPSNPRTNRGNRKHRGSVSPVLHLYHNRGR